MLIAPFAKHASEEQQWILEAIQASSDGLWEWSVSSQQIKVSPEFQKLLLHREDLNQRDYNWWVSIIHPEDMSATKEFIQNIMDDSKPEHEYECRLQKGDGTYLNAKIRGVIKRDASGQMTHLAGTVTDISPQRQLESQFEKAIQDAEQVSQAKSQFIATLNHELRAPLNGIMGMCDMLKDTYMEEDQKKFVSNIEASSEMLLTLVNDILDVSKIESGRFEIERQALCINDIIERSMELVRPGAKVKDLQLNILIDPRIPRNVIGDPTRLQQILVNLLSNAVKFTEQGYVSITTRESDNKNVPIPAGHKLYRVEVTDTGTGIPEDVQKNLFQDYTQGNVSIQRRFGGTGLGLSICKKLVALMGGEIGVFSTLGQGSTFWFDVPLKVDTNPQEVIQNPEVSTEPPTPKAVPAEQGQQKLRILLAEDNDINQQVMIGLIGKIGDELEIANNGQEAVDLFEKNSYDIVLMDINMPVMDGLTATDHIRKHPNGKDIPIVAITANMMVEDKTECLEHGMNDVATKPVNKEKLEGILNEYRNTDQTDSTQTTPSEGQPEAAEPIDPEAPATEPMIVAETLATLTEDLGEESIHMLLGIYKNDAPALVDQIAPGSPDGETAAHTLAGMSENLGIFGVGKIAREIMKAYKESSDNLGQLSEQLQKNADQAYQEIDTVLGS